MGVCVVREHDVRVDPVDEQVAQHGHERGDAAAAGDHEQLRGHRVGQDEIAEGLAQLDDVADRDTLVQIPRHSPPGVTLHGERDGAAGGRRVRRAVDAGVTYAIDLDRELHVLAGTKAQPVGVGTQHEAEDAAGLRADRLDPRQDAVQAELRAELARIEVEHVLVEERAQDRRRQQAGEGRGEARERGGVGRRAVRPPRGHVMSSRESGVAGITDDASEGVGARPGGGAVSGGDPGLPVRTATEP